MLGPPPMDLLERGARRKEFFDGEGNWIAEIDISHGLTLEGSEKNLDGEKKEEFLQFVRCTLQWRPEDRWTAKELLGHPWMKGK